jgi:hypothetical protein
MLNVANITQQLQQTGIVVLENLLPEHELSRMQQCFEQQLAHPRFNTSNGYQQNEKWRLLIEDLLTLSPAFLFPLFNQQLMDVCCQYIGSGFQLTEARGWQTIQTNRNFHGWHNDAWYDLDSCATPPPQIKIGIYLSPVASGEFCYVQTSHLQKLAPNHWNKKQVGAMDLPVRHVMGKAGTVFLFDTAGIHCQNSPVLDKRNVVFFNFHDPKYTIQATDQSYDRYAPLLLNAAFLKNLSKEQERILGFGDERYFHEQSIPLQRYPWLHKLTQLGLDFRLLGQDWQQFYRRLTRFR